MTDKTFTLVLKWGFITLVIGAFAHSNLFSIILSALITVAVVVLAIFLLHWFLRGERLKWRLRQQRR